MMYGIRAQTFQYRTLHDVVWNYSAYSTVQYSTLHDVIWNYSAYSTVQYTT